MPNTIVYITDNSLDERLAEMCRRVLLREARNLPIVSVSHKPVDLGHNICVGEIGRSWRSFYTQILTALDNVDTETVAIAEHDCLYTHEALAFVPPDLSVFWYNSNCWLVQYGDPRLHVAPLDGMYSYWPQRIPFSQLTCSTALLRQSVEEIYRLLDMGLKLDKGARWYGEPGVIEGKLKKAAIEAGSGRCTQLQKYLKEYVTKYDHRTWVSTYPSLDIRHGTNFTGPKRGSKRRYELPFWGKFEDVWGNA